MEIVDVPNQDLSLVTPPDAAQLDSSDYAVSTLPCTTLNNSARAHFSSFSPMHHILLFSSPSVLQDAFTSRLAGGRPEIVDDWTG